MILRFADLCVPIGLQLLSVAASSDLICPNFSHLRYDKFMDFSTFFFFKSTFVFFFRWNLYQSCVLFYVQIYVLKQQVECCSLA